MKRIITGISFIFLMLSILVSTSRGAGNDIVLTGKNIVQNEFRDLSKEVGLIISYVPLSPAEPLGLIGLDIGVEVTAARISAGSSFWTKAVSDLSPPDYIIVPKVHVQKGLPMRIDVGAIFSTVPGSNITLYGGEIKWAIVEGSIVSPAVAVRGAFTTLAGVDDLDASTYSLDASISKGLGPLTPYTGMGQVWIKTEEKAGLGLDNVSAGASKFFLGARLNILLLSLVLEADFSDIPMYSMRANFSF